MKCFRLVRTLEVIVYRDSRGSSTELLILILKGTL